jgi:hypothetical protein
VGININELTLGQARELAGLFVAGAEAAAACQPTSPVLGKHCVIRTYSAGVHLGTVVSHSGKEVLLKDARRLWKWVGAFTLNEVAAAGVKKDGSRIAAPVSELLLTEAIEIIPTTETARASYEACRE